MQGLWFLFPNIFKFGINKLSIFICLIFCLRFMPQSVIEAQIKGWHFRTHQMLLRTWGPAWCSLDTTVPGLPPVQFLPGPLSLLGSHDSTSFYAYSSFPGAISQAALRMAAQEVSFLRPLQTFLEWFYCSGIHWGLPSWWAPSLKQGGSQFLRQGVGCSLTKSSCPHFRTGLPVPTAAHLRLSPFPPPALPAVGSYWQFPWSVRRHSQGARGLTHSPTALCQAQQLWGHQTPCSAQLLAHLHHALLISSEDLPSSSWQLCGQYFCLMMWGRLPLLCNNPAKCF